MASKFRIIEKQISNSPENKRRYFILYKGIFGWYLLTKKTVNTINDLTFNTYKEAEEYLVNVEFKDYYSFTKPYPNEYHFIRYGFYY